MDLDLGVYGLVAFAGLGVDLLGAPSHPNKRTDNKPKHHTDGTANSRQNNHQNIRFLLTHNLIILGLVAIHTDTSPPTQCPLLIRITGCTCIFASACGA